jgi:hypothetical protein
MRCDVTMAKAGLAGSLQTLLLAYSEKEVMGTVSA